MYKFAAHSTRSSHLFLIKQNVINGNCSLLVITARSYANEPIKCTQLKTCPPTLSSPPCPPKKKSNTKLYATLGAIVLTGSAVTFAKYSPDTRKWLDNNWPWASDFVGAMFQEQKTYGQQLNEKWNALSDTVEHFLFGEEETMPIKIPYRSEQNIEEEAKKFFQPKQYEPLIVATEPCEVKKPLKPKVTEDQMELEETMHRCTKDAVELYEEALKVCKKYNTMLTRVVLAPAGQIDQKDLDSLKGVKDLRNKAAAKAKEASTCAKCAIETILRKLRKKEVLVPDQDLAILERYSKTFMNDIERAEQAYRDCEEQSDLTVSFWEKVKAARNLYQDELKILFPEFNINERKPFAVGDTDLLLVYTAKQITEMQRQIAEMQTTRDMKLQELIACSDSEELINLRVESLMENERQKLNEEFSKKELEIIMQSKKKLQEAMKAQFEMFQCVLNDQMRKYEQEKFSQLNKLVNEKLTEDTLRHKEELARMTGRLKAIEDCMKNRLNQANNTVKSLEVWTAAEALLAATRRPEPEILVKNEISALEQAGKGDKMVNEVLKGLRPELKEGRKKITTEKALQDKFDKFEKNAKSVALVGPEGAALPVYFLSWLQSKLLFENPNIIPREELNNTVKIDFTKFDTFDIMLRARYHMERGNLQDAVRYVNLLSGAPRAAAQSWLDDARTFMEVRQAAEVVMANASLHNTPLATQNDKK